MALSAATVFEVRSGASDSSGGGFVAGASGTDRSQSDTAFANGTNLTVDATTNTDVAPDGYSPVAADVGNLIQITTTGGGAAFTVGFYQISSIQSGKWRLDRSPAATSSAGATWAMGGALATLNKAVNSAHVASNTIWVKASATYTENTKLTIKESGSLGSLSTKIIGYGTTRGDNGQATVRRTSGTATMLGYTSSGNGISILNLIVDCNSLAAIGLEAGALYASNVTVQGATNLGFSSTGTAILRNCRAINGSGQAGFYLGGSYHGCVASGNTCSGFWFDGTQIRAIDCISANNSGGSSHGFRSTAANVNLINCTAYNNGGNGANFTAGDSAVMANCLFVSNAGYGASSTASVTFGDFWNNAYYSNTSGATSNLPAGGGDVTLSASPFVNAGSGNFALNTTAGGGGACRAAGFPGAFPGGTTTGFLDIGAAQSQASAAGGLMMHPGMTGRISA